MDVSGTRIAVDRVLEDTLESLTRSGSPPVLPASELEDWGLSGPARSVLLAYGLPPERDDGLMGVAGEFQNRVLGRYGSARIVAESNAVLAVPRSTAVHHDLAGLYPEGVTPTTVNSSVPAFVECAWRWHWIVPLLAEAQHTAGEAEIQAWKDGVELADAYLGYQQLCSDVLERFRAIDPAIDADTGFWSGVIIDLG
ncbi:SUKH-4 family immunity protein [Actinoplanes sp. CA-015351]|uniref:SUKH-4 family immunity protein n=1 Tax=Actinoplanes sp. CA-015351 TaxID=3239897 RepID=UPI003D987021